MTNPMHWGGPVVVNLATQEETPFFSSCTPRLALLGTYARSLRDGNSWDYERRYGHLVQETEKFLCLGDFCVAKEVKKP